MPSMRVITSLPSLDCCESFFKCLEVLPGDGTGYISDSVTRARFNPAQENPGDPYADIPLQPSVPEPGLYWMENGADQSVYSICNSAIEVRNGNLPNFKKRKIILFGCGFIVDITKVRLPFGNGAGADPVGTAGVISLSFGGQMHGLILSTTNTLNDTTSNPFSLDLQSSHVGSFVGIIVEYTPAVGAVPGLFHAKVVDSAGVTLTASDLSSPVEQNIVCSTEGDVSPSLNNKTRFGGMAWQSIMAFSFDAALPADREEVYKWLMVQHKHGNRVLPPRWQHLASSR